MMTLQVSKEKNEDGRFRIIAKNHAVIFEATAACEKSATAALEKRIRTELEDATPLKFERDENQQLVRISVG